MIEKWALISVQGEPTGAFEPTEAFNVAPDAAASDNSSRALGDESDDATNGRVDLEHPSTYVGARGKPFGALEEDSTPEALSAAVAAPNGQQFLRGLVSALGRAARTPVVGETSLGTVLRQLGRALEEELDEELAFNDLVCALERKRLGLAALQESALIVTAFVARIVAWPKLRTVSAVTSVEIKALVDAAQTVVGASLKAEGGRAWRRLPYIAATIARHVARRDLSIAALTEALPQLAGRFGSGPRDAAVSGRDPPPGHAPRGSAAGKPRRMLISGPVEIVILDR
jgi:hypothetical protein